MFGKKSPKAPPPSSQEPVDENRAPDGDGRIHNAGLGNIWAALTGHDPATLIPQVVGTVLHEGGSRPAWQWKRGGREHILMAWPQDEPIRAAVLMAGPEGGDLRPMTAVPLLEGLPNDLEVDDVHPLPEGMGGDVAAAMLAGQNPMWFFDPLFDRDRSDLTPGVTHTFWLAGLALSIRKALLDEITITQGPRYEEFVAEWLAANPEKKRQEAPPLKLDIKGKRFIMPGRFFGEYQLRAEVDRIQDCRLERAQVKILYLSFPFENRKPLLLPLYVSAHVLGEMEVREGMEIESYAWLEGRIIDLEAGEAAGGSGA